MAGSYDYHRARCKALAWLLQGLLLWRAATLSGMGRGVTMWYALMTMRRDGQTLVVVADRGFAEFAWLGLCPDYR